MADRANPKIAPLRLLVDEVALLRILFVTKRLPQQRDLIERPFGRFHHLPVALADLGHDVLVQLYSFRRLATRQYVFDGVSWSGHDLISSGPRRLWQTVKGEAESFQPDWVIGCSDAWFGCLAHHLSGIVKARLMVDAYDNFESYMPWNLPLRHAWRRAVRAADLVTAAGPGLANYLQRSRRNGLEVQVLSMAADPRFSPLDRGMCRDALDLPRSAPLIGYSGSWSRSRGTPILLAGYGRLRDSCSDARLVLSGCPPGVVRGHVGVVATGYLEDDQIPVLINALDVVCVISANTMFGRFSYPAKLYEAMACGVPVVASATAPVQWILQNRKEFLVEVGNAEAIAQRILTNLEMGRVNYGCLPSWRSCAGRLEKLLSLC